MRGLIQDITSSACLDPIRQYPSRKEHKSNADEPGQVLLVRLPDHWVLIGRNEGFEEGRDFTVS